MYSTTDTGLPFGTNQNYLHGWGKIIDITHKSRSMSGIEIDLWYMRDQVRTAYKDLILNY